MLDQLLPPGSIQRKLVFGLGALFAILLVTQVLLPGGRGGRGTPMAVMFQATVFGSVHALTAMGIVLVYRMNRVINFAQAALGAIGAIVAYNFVVAFGLPYGIAFVVGVALSGAIGAGVDLVFVRRFFDAPRLVLTIVTIGLATLLMQFAMPLVAGLDLWGEGRDPLEQFGGTPVNPLPDFRFTIGDLGIPFGFGHLFALFVVAAALVGIGAFFRYTRLGVAVRASAENAERSELLGINVHVLSTVVWMLAGALAGAGVTLYGTVASFAIGAQGAPDVLLIALAAAVLARMQSLPVAVFAAIAITVLQAAVGWSFQGQQELVAGALFFVIAGGLLLQRKALQRAEEVSTWEATEEIRPTPREMFTVPGVRFWRTGLLALGAVMVLLYPWMVGTGYINMGALAAVVAIAIISLVVLTGWAGQVSLAQFALLGVGAVIGANLTATLGLPFWVALPLAGVLTGVVAVGVGLPALRIKGLYLAVVTFSFAAAVFFVLSNQNYRDALLPDSIPRPTLLLLDFEDERSMYYLCVAVLGAVVAMVLGLRRTRPGRVLIALRENETELQAFGINVVRTKLAAFALAGFLCGVAGIVYAHHQRAISPLAFEAQESLMLFVFAVLGGISSISGALIGAVLWAAFQLFPGVDPILDFILNPAFGLLVILYVMPGGLASLFYGMRDSILRIVAQRRQMVVPALFEDYDPTALERRLVPLAETVPGAGLGSLPFDQRYRLPSELYGRSEIGDTRRRAPDERDVLGAAAESASETD